MNQESPNSDPLEPRRIVGRVFVITRLILFLGAVGWLFFDHKLLATVFLLCSFFMGAWASFKIHHEDIERPFALFWLKLGDNLLVNIIFLVLFLRLLFAPLEPFPTLLCTGLVILTLRNIFYLIFSISLLNEHRTLPLNTFWSKTTHFCLITTAVLYMWNTGHPARIGMVAGILFMFSTGIGYLYFYYRNAASRKPLSVASQITFSRILLSPVFIWVFFYDNNLVYQDNHLVFKILAALLAIFFVASDGLDGYLARKRGEVTQLGKYLDPYSDKISNMTIFLCFMASGYAAVWMVAVIFFRESTIETLRTLGAAAGVTIDARRSGKWKTALQGTAVITILVLEIVDTLIQRFWPDTPYWTTIWNYTPYTLMSLVTAVTLLSGVDYFVANKKVLERYF